MRYHRYYVLKIFCKKDPFLPSFGGQALFDHVIQKRLQPVVVAVQIVENTWRVKLLYVNAGHNPPLLRRAGGGYDYLRTRSGFVLAGVEETRYRSCSLELAPGDALFLYTDGVTEATDAEKQLYGEERLATALNSHKDYAPKELLSAVRDDVEAFVGQAPQFDDITVLSLCYYGQTQGI